MTLKVAYYWGSCVAAIAAVGSLELASGELDLGSHTSIILIRTALGISFFAAVGMRMLITNSHVFYTLSCNQAQTLQRQYLNP